MRTHKLLCFGALAALPAAFLGLPAGRAFAANEIVIPLTVVNGDPGSEHQIADQPVDADQVGKTCTVVYATENNDSLHPNTDIIVSSGSSQTTLSNVEEAVGTTEGSTTLTLASSVQVTVRLGSDGIASLGADLVFNCTAVSDTGGGDGTDTNSNGGGGDQLPGTGVSTSPALGLGVVLLASGMMLATLNRKRHTRLS